MFIRNYEMYSVDEYGNITREGKRLKPFRCGKNKNYWKVRLYKDGIGKDHSVHRLVADAFIPNPHTLPHVNHIDEETSNNCKLNLEWCTAQYNKEYSSSKHYAFKSPEGEIVEVFNLSNFCREHNLSNGSMYHLMSGKYKHHKGWTLTS